jgi:hypothetical protein
MMACIHQHLLISSETRAQVMHNICEDVQLFLTLCSFINSLHSVVIRLVDLHTFYTPHLNLSSLAEDVFLTENITMC